MIPRRSLLNVFLLLLPFLLFPLVSTLAIPNVTLRGQEADDSKNDRLSPLSSSASNVDDDDDGNGQHQDGGIYPCNHAPTPLDMKICLMILNWRKDANKLVAERRFRTDIPPSSPDIVMDAERMTLSQAEERYDCMDLACLCQKFDGNLTDAQNCMHRGQTMKKAVRKEYRMLSKEERDRFHKALYLNKIGELQEYDKLAALHHKHYAPMAHGGPAFVLWHREYLKRMEIALRFVEPTTAIPYWDSTLDKPLENPRDSVLWTSELLGDIDDEGNIISDIFANWTVLMETKKETLKRKLSDGNLIDNEEVGNFLIANKLLIYGFSANNPNCHQPNKKEKANDAQVFVLLEQIHDHVHEFVGEHMPKKDDTTVEAEKTIEFEKVELGICADGHECCDHWMLDGWCELRPRYMNLWCRGSCRYNKCVRNFYLEGDRNLTDSYCNDRNRYCDDWVKINPRECEINPVWMAENCRNSCDHCDTNRFDLCRGLEPLY